MSDPTRNVKPFNETFGGDEIKTTSWKLEASYYLKVANEITVPTIPPSKTVVGG